MAMGCWTAFFCILDYLLRCGILGPILNLLVPTITASLATVTRASMLTFCGVKGAPLVVNAVWLIDEFTAENGATRWF